MCLQAIARKLHEKEMKEERRRQKHQDEEYYEDPVGEANTAALFSQYPSVHFIIVG